LSPLEDVTQKLIFLQSLSEGFFGGNALGASIQSYGEAVQRYLSGVDAQYHATCLPPHVLQQYGEIRNEPEDAAVPYGA